MFEPKLNRGWGLAVATSHKVIEVQCEGPLRLFSSKGYCRSQRLDLTEGSGLTFALVFGLEELRIQILRRIQHGDVLRLSFMSALRRSVLDLRAVLSWPSVLFNALSQNEPK